LFKKLLSAFSAAAIMTLSVSGEVVKPPEPVNLTILMYHFLNDISGDYAITPGEFERDLAYIRDNGYTTVGVSDIIDFVYDGKPLPKKPVMLTFDDGYYNNYYYGLPLLEKYDAKANISILGEHTEKWSDNYYEDLKSGHVTWWQVDAMRRSGRFEIGNHTYNMHALGKYRKGCARAKGESVSDYQHALGKDLEKLQTLLSDKCGITPDFFAFPYHEVSEEAFVVLKAIGFRAAFTGSGKTNVLTPGDTECLYNLKRVNRTRLKPAEAILKSV